MEAVRNYVVDLAAQDVALEVWLNGVLLVHADATGGYTWASKVDQWVVGGANRLEAKLAHVPPRPPPAPASASPKFKLVVRSVQLGPSTAGDATLAEYEWRPGQPPLGPSPLTAFRAELPLAPRAPWRWVGADRLPTLAGADRAAIVDLVTQLAAALRARDVERVVALQTLQLQEMAVATGQEPAGMLQRYGQFLRGRMSAADWRVEATPPAQLEFTGMAEGRLWHVLGPGATPPVAAFSNGSLFAPDPYLSRLAGHWAITR